MDKGLSMSDLEEAAYQIGEAVGHSWSSYQHTEACPGCRAERAALMELEKAVAGLRADKKRMDLMESWNLETPGMPIRIKDHTTGKVYEAATLRAAIDAMREKK